MKVQPHVATIAVVATMVLLIAAPAPSWAAVMATFARVFANADGLSGRRYLTDRDRNYRWYANPNAEVAVSGDNMVALNGDIHATSLTRERHRFGSALGQRSSSRSTTETPTRAWVEPAGWHGQDDRRRTPFDRSGFRQQGVALVGGIRF